MLTTPKYRQQLMIKQINNVLMDGEKVDKLTKLVDDGETVTVSFVTKSRFESEEQFDKDLQLI